MKNIVVFASGSGSNAENLIKHFRNRNDARVIGIFSNNANAKVLEKAADLEVPSVIFSKAELHNKTVLLKLQVFRPDIIVLAGFLLQLPPNIIDLYPSKIINIHPALLPKFGGKGMYGMNVHNAVIAHEEIETGISIHYIDQHYDEGAVIFQKKFALNGDESAQDVANSVQLLEHQFLPIIIEQILNSQIS